MPWFSNTEDRASLRQAGWRGLTPSGLVFEAESAMTYSDMGGTPMPRGSPVVSIRSRIYGGVHLVTLREGQRLGVKPRHLGKSARARAFSLLEVVAAVAIFAIGMVGVLGLFAPVAKTISTVSDAEAAARVADAVRARLRALPFDRALALIQEVEDVRKNDGDGTYNPNDGTKHPAVLFGKLSGDVGMYDAAEGRRAWYDSSVPTPQRLADGDKFFEIDLIRNETLSPKDGDATAAMAAFIMRVRWPAFVMTSPTTAVQSGQNLAGGAVPFDHSRKQVLFFTGAIRR